MHTCSAHTAVIREFSRGLDRELDPVSEECAKWLAKITMGLPCAVHPVATAIARNDISDLDTFEEVRGGKDYMIYRKGDHLVVRYIDMYEQGPPPKWYRFDLQVTGWSNANLLT